MPSLPWSVSHDLNSSQMRKIQRSIRADCVAENVIWIISCEADGSGVISAAVTVESLLLLSSMFWECCFSSLSCLCYYLDCKSQIFSVFPKCCTEGHLHCYPAWLWSGHCSYFCSTVTRGQSLQYIRSLVQTEAHYQTDCTI